jgi:TPR repeat protein
MQLISFRSLRYLSLVPLLGSLIYSSGVIAEKEVVSLAEIRKEFIAQDDFRTNLHRLMELEQQTLALIEDEPLKMGSFGSAILDIYAASQTGHLALSRYYEHVEAIEAQNGHEAELTRIQSAMFETGTGNADTPYEIMTIYDAHAFARTFDLSPVGSIYQSSEDAIFGFLLVARPEKAKLRQVFFDVSHLLPALGKPHDTQKSDRKGEDDHPINPWSVIRILAAESDGAAQTAIGAYLTNIKKYEDAMSWLKVASRSGNVLANTLLSRIYWTQSNAEKDADKKTDLEQLAEENYLHAIALGSTDAMYSLAGLYLSDQVEAGDVSSGLALLEQSGDLGHAESLVYLAHIYNSGQHVGESSVDQTKAHEYFQKAAALNHAGAVLSYGRFLVAERYEVDPEESVFAALTEMADNKETEAMVVIANLHARGLAPKASSRNAVKWYKRAVKAKPDDPDVVNEVAWTLTVSEIRGIKKPRYAKRIMDKLMKSVEAARDRPEYLDTWAATHAATGDFAGAIELQLKAIEVAKKLQREDVLDILSVHLEQFEADTSITEPAP